ncbi:MAG: hypothetical protein M1828_004887 [Chrysothrix sp. TS-e1954]|nr:MAG: hypothetical protein M1828_004887 [Chrysothrix sp. TS-e1954]
MAAPTNLKYLSKLVNKNILVLGGTSGIGFCIAEAALEHNAHVTISGSNEQRIASTLKRLQTSYPQFTDNVSGYTADLADRDNLETNLTRMLDLATENGRRKLDHVAFSAGDALAPVGLKDATPEAALTRFNVRYLAPLILAKLLFHAGYMNISPDSSLTLTSGTMGDKPAPGWAISAGMGASVEGMMRGLAVDMKPVRVNCVSPGAIDTELFQNRGPEVAKAALENFRKETTVGRVGRPTDTAECYLVCMKDGFLTGETLRTMGGRLLT